MSDQLTELLGTLSAPQRTAIRMVQLSLDLYNSKDGDGLFTGVSRYNVLNSRLEICAVQADSLPRFWALLLRRMQWPVPPKHADERLLSILAEADGVDVLRVLATETASIVTLARMAHDATKQARKNERELFETPTSTPTQE